MGYTRIGLIIFHSWIIFCGIPFIAPTASMEVILSHLAHFVSEIPSILIGFWIGEPFLARPSHSGNGKAWHMFECHWNSILCKPFSSCSQSKSNHFWESPKKPHTLPVSRWILCIRVLYKRFMKHWPCVTAPLNARATFKLHFDNAAIPTRRAPVTKPKGITPLKTGWNYPSYLFIRPLKGVISYNLN